MNAYGGNAFHSIKSAFSIVSARLYPPLFELKIPTTVKREEGERVGGEREEKASIRSTRSLRRAPFFHLPRSEMELPRCSTFSTFTDHRGRGNKPDVDVCGDSSSNYEFRAVVPQNSTGITGYLRSWISPFVFAFSLARSRGFPLFVNIGDDRGISNEKLSVKLSEK